MKHSEDREVFECELAEFWFDDDGILCSYSKSAPRTLQKQREAFELVRKIIGDKKVCLFLDATFIGPQEKEAREFVAIETPKLFKAVAFMTGSAMGTLVVDAFLNFIDKPTIPMRVFPNEREAKEWLKQYL